MPAQYQLLNYGQATKSTSFNNFPMEAWVKVVGEKEYTRNPQYARVPWVYAAADLIASSVMTAPLYFVRGDNEWKNGDEDAPPVDWFNDWSIMAYKVVFSALNYGAGYVNNDPMDFRFLSPDSIQEEMDTQTGMLRGFYRTVNGRRTARPLPPEDIAHFWWFKDPTTEIGRANIYPAKVALSASNVLHSYQVLLKRYNDSGAVGVKILQSDIPMREEDAKELKTRWERIVSGVSRAFGQTILNTDAKVMTLSDKLSEFYDPSVVQDARRDVEVAFGLPETMLNQAANLATKQADQVDFYTNVVSPVCDWVATTINRQCAPALRGYRMVYRINEIQAMQRDENEVADSVLKYVAAGFGRENAADLLGVDLTDEQRAQIQRVDEVAFNNLILTLTDLGGTSRRRDPNAPDITPNADTPATMPMRSLEVGQLERWVQNRLKRGKSVLPDDFTAEYLSDAEVKAIIARETGTAEDSPFPATTIKQVDGTLAERVVVGKPLASIQKEFARLLQPQIDGFKKRKALQAIGIAAMRQIAEAITNGQSTRELQRGLHPAIRDNMPELASVEYESDPKPAIIAALLGFGAFGITHEKGDIGATQLALIEAELTRYTAERVASLVGEPTSSGYVLGDTIANPHVPESLDEGSVTMIAMSIIAALGILVSNDDTVTLTAIEALLVAELARRLLNRADLIGENEAGRMANVGQYLTAVSRGATAKKWLETTSKQPRVEHLAQVGVVVGINEVFPSGNSWSGEEINCKCGIEVIYGRNNQNRR